MKAYSTKAAARQSPTRESQPEFLTGNTEYTGQIRSESARSRTPTPVFAVFPVRDPIDAGGSHAGRCAYSAFRPKREQDISRRLAEARVARDDEQRAVGCNVR